MEILLVEDNAGDVDLTLHALRKDHMANRIHVARDGEEALAFLFDSQKANHVHLKLVLLDLKLPKVDGLEVLKVVKRMGFYWLLINQPPPQVAGSGAGAKP